MTLIRSALFNLWFYGLTTVMAIWGIVVRKRDWPEIVIYARLWASLSLGGLRRICGVNWRIEGGEHLPTGGPALIASMHQSAFDTLIWTMIVPAYTYVLKRELTRVPMFGPLLIASGMIPVDRAAGMSALRGLMRDTDRAVAQGRQIVIFPEGTRVPFGERAPLLPGVAAIAARSGLPVIPVVTDSGLHWGRKSFWKHSGTITIRILPPIPAGLPREVLMQEIERAFATGSASFGHRGAYGEPANAATPVDNSGGEARDILSARSKRA